MEVWKRIDGTGGIYEISNGGVVRRVVKNFENRQPRIIKQFLVLGYPSVNLSVSGSALRCAIHRLVAIAFIPNKDNKTEVNHINGDRSDYRIDNLEWCTHKENMNHAHKTGLVKKTTKTIVSGVEYYSLREAMRSTGLSYKNIRKTA